MTLLRKTFLPPISDLLAFEAAARHASISRAAQELHLTQSAVSRQIRQLERQLGMALFHRVRQRIVLTDAGRVYAADVRVALQQLSASTQQAMAFSHAGGLLNLAVLPTLGTRWLVPRLPRFLALHPQATVNLAARTEPFDFAGTPFDAAIHFGAPSWPGAVCRFLMREEVVPVASPAFRAAHDIATAHDLTRVALLQQSTRPTQWSEWFEQAGVATTVALRGARCEHFSMLAQAAVSGLGAALLPRFLIEQELAAGSLVQLAPQALASAGAYHLVYPEARAHTPLVVALRDWLVRECAAGA
ncbi:DNA-binding transcriptional regulator, LysR family [Oryzisolibacter propanilivorax]|uniref:DNA-binding transcriptional regulator, LysR family n=1 Tax=Oryzisolibacter propanilivorax TaxID=1527607 RepID=A0A1G9T054_9BURK|nr:LysR family transcriptional regulator [Oryzisolibacter propanilivorax]SDM41071.1 DNA-binding transcriptional regulator, LysR family [Oryzisolibacter propanilivorax]